MKRREVQCPQCGRIESVRKPTYCHCTGNPTKMTAVGLQRQTQYVTGRAPANE